MNNLRSKYKPGDWFIQKKIWGTFRNGLDICKYEDNLENHNYDQIQKLETDTLKINNRVFHIRIYLIIDCDKGNYLYNEGIIIYCTEPFDKKNIKKDNIITNIKNNRYVYEPNNLSFMGRYKLPKTLTELYIYLKKHNLSSNKLKKNLIELFKKYVDLKEFCKEIPIEECPSCSLGYESVYKNKKFKNRHLYGADVIVRENLKPIILEVNQKPGMNYMYDQERSWQNPIKEYVLKSLSTRKYPLNKFSLL